MKLKGKVAIVTGSAKSIGNAIARRLAEDGAHVLIADVSDTAQAAAEAIAKEFGVETDFYVGDLTQKEHPVGMVQKAVERWGRVDILVNNAGGGVILPFFEHTEETMELTINRNLWTTLRCCRAVMKQMVEQNYGRIINIGADSVRNGLYDHAVYNAAKGGVIGLSNGLAREFAAYDITVNTVSPCAVQTDDMARFEREKPDIAAKFLSVIPKGRAAKQEEVAATVSFLATDDAGFITGQHISVNGGSAML